jgi:hypothetical protein
MKKMIFLIVILCFSIEVVGQEKVDSTKTLEDIVVKETFQISVEEEKYPAILSADFSDIIKIPDGIHWNSVNWKNKTDQNGDWDSFNFNLSQPEFANIRTQPIKIFHAQFSDLSKWSLTIHESNGSLYKTISGENNPPGSIFWDGIGEQDQLLNPGQNYTYNFIATDKAGNKRTFPGETFSISAYHFTTGDSLFVGISCSKLFSSDGLGLTQQASDYACELASLIKYYLKKGKISYETSHPQKDEFISLLSKNLKLNAAAFKHKQSYKKNNNDICFWIE